MGETAAARRSIVPTRPLGAGDPETVGPYRLLGFLGAGGMGRVYLGCDSGGRSVAVKVVRPDLAGDKTFRTRFRREVAAARRVAGPHTVPVYDADIDGPQPWLATGYVSGPSLTDAVETFGPLPEPSLLALGVGLARALLDVHATGMVHRDLKPSNVLLAQDGPRVIDFGIARIAQDETALTTTGKIIGSPGYMSPEQISGGVTGPPGDVFALGGVLVYAATGVAPFGTGDTISMLWRVMQEEPGLDGVPERLRGIVAACLAKDPRDRPTPAQLERQLAGLCPPATERWLPASILAEIRRRTVELAELEAAPAVRTAVATSPLPGERATATSSAPGIDASPSHPTSVRRHRRPVVLAGVAVVALLAAGVLGVVVANGVSGRGTGHAAVATTNPSVANSGGEQPSTTHPGTATSGRPASAVDSLPAAYVGTWKGSATDGSGTFDVVLTLQSGKAGQDIGTAVTTGRAKQGMCTRREALVFAGPTRVTLRTKPAENGPAQGRACGRMGVVTTLERNSDGTLTYTNGLNTDMTGILHRGK
ncbi:serine/threonine-protein kinase [Nocardia macrotermitis]|nr:serine/threonine-protein kinase [Nocardia macrotermitis]